MEQPFLFIEMISYEFCSHGRCYLEKPLWVPGEVLAEHLEGMEWGPHMTSEFTSKSPEDIQEGDSSQRDLWGCLKKGFRDDISRLLGSQ